MAQPDRSGPKTKTLYELAEERSALLSKGQPFDPKHQDGKVRDEQGRVLEDAPIGHVGESIFLSSSLAMLHFTLDVLVYQQYRQDIEWFTIAKRTITLFPVLFFSIYMLHTKTAKSLDLLRQLFHLALAVGAGCYMIYAGNTYDYYAMMKRAPPLGTLWIWSVIEMRLPYALLSIVIDGAFLLKNGYTMF